jgi:hypothetical protein
MRGGILDDLRMALQACCEAISWTDCLAYIKQGEARRYCKAQTVPAHKSAHSSELLTIPSTVCHLRLIYPSRKLRSAVKALRLSTCYHDQVWIPRYAYCI